MVGEAAVQEVFLLLIHLRAQPIVPEAQQPDPRVKAEAVPQTGVLPVTAAETLKQEITTAAEITTQEEDNEILP